MNQNPRTSNAGSSDPTEPPPNTAARRVAVFSWADDGLVQRLFEAGLEIAYLYDGDFGTEHLVFEDVPPFDLLAASLPDEEAERHQAWELVLLFIRARTPVSFVLIAWDRGDTAEFFGVVGERVRPMDYAVALRSGPLGLVFVVGLHGGSTFDWPTRVVPSG